jgi:hypothetical protein
MNEIEVSSKPRRAQGGKDLLSRSIHVQSLHKSMSKIPNSREERDREEERRAPRQGALVWLPWEKKREKEGEEGEGVFNPNNSQPKRLDYP